MSHLLIKGECDAVYETFHQEVEDPGAAHLFVDQLKNVGVAKCVNKPDSERANQVQ